MLLRWAVALVLDLFCLFLLSLCFECSPLGLLSFSLAVLKNCCGHYFAVGLVVVVEVGFSTDMDNHGPVIVDCIEFELDNHGPVIVDCIEFDFVEVHIFVLVSYVFWFL